MRSGGAAAVADPRARAAPCPITKANTTERAKHSHFIDKCRPNLAATAGSGNQLSAGSGAKGRAQVECGGTLDKKGVPSYPSRPFFLEEAHMYAVIKTGGKQYRVSEG